MSWRDKARLRPTAARRARQYQRRRRRTYRGRLAPEARVQPVPEGNLFGEET